MGASTPDSGLVAFPRPAASGPIPSAIEDSGSTAATDEGQATTIPSADNPAQHPNPGDTTSATGSTIDIALPQRQPIPAHLQNVVTNQLVAIHLGPGEQPMASGLFIDGVVLTSASAIAANDEVTLTFQDHRYTAEVVARDAFTDLAVLRPPQAMLDGASGPTPTEQPDFDWPDPERSAEPEPVDNVDIGHEVVVGITITLVATDGQPEPIAVTGLVIGVNQTVRGKDGHAIVGAFETSARRPEFGLGAVLVDDDGNPVGIVVDSEGYVATGIPLSAARAIAANLMTNGWASDAWIGIEGKEVGRGVEVTSLQADGPAALAGIQRGDIIHSVGETATTDMAALVEQLRRLRPGLEVAIRVVRDNAVVTLFLVVADHPPTDPDGADPSSGEPSDSETTMTDESSAGDVRWRANSVSASSGG